MTNNNKTDVLIIGAGPVGLSLAIELIRQNVNCRIIDKLHQATDQSRAAGIHARTLEVFNQMGVVDEIIKQGLPATGMSLYSDQERIAHLNYSIVDSPYKFAIMLPQANTEAILTTYLKSQNKEVERDLTLMNLQQTEIGVTATLNHANETTETIEAKYVVGCDGAHSKVRHLLNFDFPGSDYKEAWILADVVADWQEKADEIHIFLSDPGLFMVFPMGNNRFRIGADHRGENIALEAETSEEEITQLAKIELAGKMKIHEFNWLTKFRIHHRKVSTYQHNRIFLAGDAAHIHSPAGGQGMNTGIQDGFNLAWKLALVLKGKSDASLLNSYTEERSPVAEGVLKDTNALTHMITLKNSLLKTVRNKVVGLVSQLDYFQHHMIDKMSELAVNYRKSNLVGENWDGNKISLNYALEVGDRAPNHMLLNPQTEKSENLFSLIRDTKHHAILFSAADTPEEGILEIQKNLAKLSDIIKVIMISYASKNKNESSNNELVYIDTNQECHKLYHADKPCLYLIRPDGYIAYRSKPLEWDKIKSYLNKNFLL